jgi:4-amino-4-deoxy-L-arabinose transferase-like glycosyltransferase
MLQRAAALRVSPAVFWVAAITVVALGLRLFWVFYTHAIPLGGDPHWYYTVAINVAKGYGFVAPRNALNEVVGPGKPTAYWPPGYSFALAAVFKPFGASFLHAKLLNATFATATVPFVYGLGAAIFDRRAGLISSLLLAVFPNAIAWVSVLFPEPLFTFLFVAALWLLTLQPARRTWLPVAAFGLLMGGAVLTRGQGIVLLPIAVTYWWARSGPVRTLRYSGIAVAFFAAALAPWTVRNAIQMHAFIPISTNSASVLRIGHAPDSTGYTLWTRDDVGGVPMDQSLYRPDWEVRSYRTYPRRAIDYALGHPQRELQLSGLKLYHTYRSDVGVISWLTTIDATPFHPAGLKDALWYVFTYSYYTIFFATVLSVPFWLRRRPERMLLASVFVFWSLFHIVFVGDVRYHVPLFPFFAIATVGGASMALEQARGAFARLRTGRYTEPATLDAPIV